MLLEEQRGATPRPNELSASQLLLRIAPGDILAHEAIMKRGLTATTSREASALAASVRVIAESTRDELHAATLELGAALLLERTAEERDDHLRHDALRLYRSALEGWPECLTAARGVRRLAERLGDDGARVEAAARLGQLESLAEQRCERLIEAAEALKLRAPPRAAQLFARALGEDPNSPRAAEGLASLARAGNEPSAAVDALRRALERATLPEQAVRLAESSTSWRPGIWMIPPWGWKRCEGRARRRPATWEICSRWSKRAWGCICGPKPPKSPRVRSGSPKSHRENAGGNAPRQGPRRAPDERGTRSAKRSKPRNSSTRSRVSMRSPLLRELSALFEKLGDAASSERALTRAVVFGGPASSAFFELSELYPVSRPRGRSLRTRTRRSGA